MLNLGRLIFVMLLCNNLKVKTAFINLINKKNLKLFKKYKNKA